MSKKQTESHTDMYAESRSLSKKMIDSYLNCNLNPEMKFLDGELVLRGSELNWGRCLTGLYDCTNCPNQISKQAGGLPNS